MADYRAEFKRILDEEVGDYAQRALKLPAAAIQAKGLLLTEDLLDSLSSQVVAASAEHVASMGVLFHQYGRIKNMKGITRTKAPPIEALKDYVKKGAKHVRLHPRLHGPLQGAAREQPDHQLHCLRPGPGQAARRRAGPAQDRVRQNFLRQYQSLHRRGDHPPPGGHRHAYRH